jgi:predicted nucleic acid-binding protein
LPGRLVADSSVIVKLFKKGEAFEKEALKLQDDVIHSRITPVISEWALLEVVRGLKKASYRRARWMMHSFC